MKVIRNVDIPEEVWRLMFQSTRRVDVVEDWTGTLPFQRNLPEGVQGPLQLVNAVLLRSDPPPWRPDVPGARDTLLVSRDLWKSMRGVP